MYKKISSPIQVQWEVTEACNHKCIYCYNFFRNNLNENLPKNYRAMFSSITDQIIDCQVFSVVITGGEPLIVFNKIAPFLERLHDKNISLSMNTNLTLLTHSLGWKIMRAGINSLLFSIPTCHEDKFDYLTSRDGAFKRMVKAIKVAQKLGFNLYPNMVVSKYNYQDIEDTAIFLKRLGINYFAATKVSKPISNRHFDHLLSMEQFRKMRMLLDKISIRYDMTVDSLQANPICSFGEYKPKIGGRTCSAGRMSVAIAPNGDIRPCIMYPDSFGNIKDGLKSSWEAMSIMRSDDIIPKECNDCKIKTSCLGGCKADALITSGKINAPDPICDSKYAVLNFDPPKDVNVEKEHFTINPKIKYRKESFGMTIFVNNSNFVFLQHALSMRIVYGSKKDINIVEIAKILETDYETAKKTACYLFERKVLLWFRAGRRW